MMESGSRAEFNIDFNKRFAGLNAQIKRHQIKIKEIVYSSLLNPSRSGAYWNNVRTAIDKEYAAIMTEFATWSEKEIPQKYRKAAIGITKRIERLKSVTNNAKIGVNDLIAAQASNQTMRALYEDALNSMAAALSGGQASLHRLTRLTQQTLINEYMIDSAVAKAMDMGNLKKAADAISGALYSKLLEGVDKELLVQAGGKRFSPDYYAELVARTKFHEAHSCAAIATCKNYGTDLVIISAHNTNTEICQQYEGKVFSLSGNDPRFPLLDAVPPFHPNCLHLMFPMFESAMEAEGVIDEFVRFSNGESDRPPYPASFTPVKERAA